MRILVASDLSERSVKALVRGALLAREHNAELVVAHAVDPLDARPAEKAAAAAEELGLQMRHPLVEGVTEKRLEVLVGEPAPTLLEAAGQLDARLIVLGEQGRRGLTEVFSGSAGEQIIRGSRCPCLIAKQPATRGYGQVAAAVDLSPDVGGVIATAAWMASGQRILVAHALDDLVRLQLISASVPNDAIALHDATVKRQTTEALLRLIADAGRNREDCEIIIEGGPPVAGLVRLFKRQHVDLAVVGTRTAAASRLKRWFLGSVAQEIAATSPCDVLVVPLHQGGQE